MINSEFLITIDFFKNWSKESLLDVLPFISRVTFHKNELVIMQNEELRDLYIIIKGSLKLDKKTPEGITTFGLVNEGSIIGDLAFIDGEKRTCNITADSEVEALKISASLIDQQPKLFELICMNLMKINSSRMRQTNAALIDALEYQVALLKEKINNARIFIFSISAFIITLFANNILDKFKINPRSALFAWLYLISLAVPFVILILKNDINPLKIGLTFKDAKKKILFCFLISLPILAVLYVLSSIQKDVSILDYQHIIKFNKEYKFFVFRYMLISFIQQYFRCILQFSLANIFTTHKEIKAICLSAIMFGIIHVQLGIFAVLVTLIGGILFGIIYSRQKNVYSLTSLHFLIGLGAYTFGVI
jgi:membrane protease YdiL (CAAX protease family)